MTTNRQRRLNRQQRDRLFDVLVKRQGKKCRACGEKRKQLVVDDIYNDGDYTTLGKQQLLCKSCNSTKNARGKGKLSPSRSGSTDDLPKIITSAEMQKNQEAEPKFRSYVFRRIRREDSIVVGEAINAGAEHACVSQQTAKRYLDKMMSTEGPLMLDEQHDPPLVIMRVMKQQAAAEPTNGRDIAQDLLKGATSQS